MADNNIKESKRHSTKKIDYSKSGYNTKSKNVYNTLGDTYSKDLEQVDFIKDPEKLLYQYRNLVHSLGKYYAPMFKSKAQREDLFSYITDTFISLVMEYDKNSGVDFAGYIDKNLRARVKYSYVQKLYGKKNRNVLIKNGDTSVEDILAYRQLTGDIFETDKDGRVTYYNNLDSDSSSTLEELIAEYDSIVDLSELDKLILTYVYSGITSLDKLVLVINNSYPQYTARAIKQAYKDLKAFLEDYYKDRLLD